MHRGGKVRIHSVRLSDSFEREREREREREPHITPPISRICEQPYGVGVAPSRHHRRRLTTAQRGRRRAAETRCLVRSPNAEVQRTAIDFLHLFVPLIGEVVRYERRKLRVHRLRGDVN